MHVWVPPLEGGDTLGSGHDTDQSDGTAAGRLDEVDGCDGASAGRQHGVDDDDVAVVEVGRELRIVRRGDGGCFIALQSDVSYPRGGHQFEDRLEHAHTGAQHRQDDHVNAYAVPVRVFTERCCDGGGAAWDVLQGLGREEQADAMSRPTECRWSSGQVPEIQERVLRQGVVDKVERHSPILYEHHGRDGCPTEPNRVLR